MVLGWTAVASALLLAYAWLFEVVWVLTIPLYGLWVLIGAGWLLMLLVKGLWRPAVTLLAAAVLLLFSPLPDWGGRLWFWISFKRHEPVYERIVASAAGLPKHGKLEGVRYHIEHGPPVRVAFPQPVGIADNGGAVVHDPTDGVATAQGWVGEAGEFSVRPDLQELWGGDIVDCDRISGHYFRCWFT